MASSVVEIIDPKTKYIANYYLDKRLRHNFDEKIIPSLLKRDKDCVIAIDGREGSGKSTLALQIGKYIDPSLNLSRVVFNGEDFREAVHKAEKGQCIIYDEAFTGLSSRSSLSGINRALVGLMMQMRQKNLFVIIVLPTFFLLDKYVALFRTRFLIHVYEIGGIRGYFNLYNTNKKKMLYLLGKKDYSYMTWKVKTRFRGRFYGVFALGDKKVEDLYRKKKEKALADTESVPMLPGQAKYKDQRDVLLYLLKLKTKIGNEEMSNYLSEYGLSFSTEQVRLIYNKFLTTSEENIEKRTKRVKKDLESMEEDETSWNDDEKYTEDDLYALESGEKAPKTTNQ